VRLGASLLRQPSLSALPGRQKLAMASPACQNRARQIRRLLNLFVGQRAERIEEYSSGSFIGLCAFVQCGLKICLGHLKRFWKVVYRMRTPPLQHKQNVGFDKRRRCSNSSGSSIARVSAVIAPRLHIQGRPRYLNLRIGDLMVTCEFAVA
jgi:hypothetical protein